MLKNFQTITLVIMFNAFDGNRLNNTKTAPEVASSCFNRKETIGA
jgi:hypothetical protein